MIEAQTIEIKSIPLSAIKRRADARALDDASVSRIVASVAEVGLINPIRVRASGLNWEVVAGSHRLAAFERMNAATIPAIIVTEDDLRAELSMIDENLCRAELSPSDRAHQTARRKAIYEELYPETKAHVAGAHASNAKQGNASANLAPAFSAATAAATGQSERKVQRDAERGEKVSAEVLAMVQGTKLDTGTYLDKLKKLPASEQFTIADRDLKLERQKDRAPKPKAATPAAKVEADVKGRALKTAANIIADHVPANEWSGLKASLYAAGIAKLADALTNVMDARTQSAPSESEVA